MTERVRDRLVMFADGSVGGTLALLAAISTRSPYERVDIVASPSQASVQATARGMEAVVRWAREHAIDSGSMPRVTVIRGKAHPPHSPHDEGPPTVLDLINGEQLSGINLGTEVTTRAFGSVFRSLGQKIDVLSLGHLSNLETFVRERGVAERIQNMAIVGGGIKQDLGLGAGALGHVLGHIPSGSIPATLVPIDVAYNREFQWTTLATQIMNLTNGDHHPYIASLLDELLGSGSAYNRFYQNMEVALPHRGTVARFGGPPVAGLVAFEALVNPGLFIHRPLSQTGGVQVIQPTGVGRYTNRAMVVEGGIPWSPSAKGMWEDVGNLYKSYT